MSIPLESVQVGRCYLAGGEKTCRIRRVVRVMPDGRMPFEHRVKTTGAEHD